VSTIIGERLSEKLTPIGVPITVQKNGDAPFIGILREVSFCGTSYYWEVCSAKGERVERAKWEQVCNGDVWAELPEIIVVNYKEST
jgi:hypothetical protein